MNRENLDLRGIPCPQNTARALIKIEILDEGDEIEIWVDDGEPVKNMLSSFALEDSLSVIGEEFRGGEGAWLVTVKKGGCA